MSMARPCRYHRTRVRNLLNRQDSGAESTSCAGRWLAMLSQMELEHYARASLVDTGTYPVGGYEPYARKVTRLLRPLPRTSQGSLRLIEKLLPRDSARPTNRAAPDPVSGWTTLLEVSQLCSAAGKAPIPGAFKLTPTQCRRAADSHGPGLLLEVLLTCPRRDKKPVAAESPIAPTRCRPDTFADGPCPVASSGPTNRVRSSTSHPNPTVDRPQSDRSCEQTVQRRRPASRPGPLS